MVISTSTFLSDVILFLKNKLKTIDDPLGRSEGFVMTAYPKRDVQYPIITIKSTNISTQKMGMQSETNLAEMNIEVRVWARNSKEADTLSQDVINTLREAQFGDGSTDVEEIHGFQLTSCVPIVEENNNATIHSKVHTFKYKVILTN